MNDGFIRAKTAELRHFSLNLVYASRATTIGRRSPVSIT